MRYFNVTLSVDPDLLIATYCDNQNITVEQFEAEELSILDMLETEMGWITPSGIYIEGEIQEVIN